MMSRSIPLLTTLFLSIALPSAAWSQDPPAVPPVTSTAHSPMPKAPPPSDKNVRVDITIALKADGKPLTKSLSMVTADGKLTQGRAGIEIPVPTQMMATAGAQPIVTYNYRSVSVGVDATPVILDASRVLLRLKLNFSTVYKPDTGGAPQPSFGQGSHEVHGIVFESGKAVIVSQSTDAETGRDYTVEVKATILK
jgi:hypothetical protein